VIKNDIKNRLLSVLIFVNYSFAKLGFVIVRETRIKKMTQLSESDRFLRFLEQIPMDIAGEILENRQKAKSQLGQELFALSQLGMMREGYFVEFGATNGIDLSNTFLLEKEFGWQGILAEPAAIWHKELESNRNSLIEKKIVWSKSGEFKEFFQTNDPNFSGTLPLNKKNHNRKSKNSNFQTKIETITLDDLLKKHDAPKVIDFLSIDTEGSEYEILNNFNFNEYQIRVICCEHNYTADREKIFDLLTAKGFTRKFTDISLWDDWYVNKLL
jgi:FkbM family methyltransferase